MSDFEWQTDEEDQWADDPIVIAPDDSGRRWLFRLATLGVIISLVGTLGYFFNRELTTRVKEAEATALLEVEQTALTLNQAAFAGDLELFNTLLSGRNTQWSLEQQTAVERGRWLDRSQFDWQVISDSVSIHSAELNPALDAAVVTLTVQYLHNDSVLTFLRPIVLREGVAQWLYAEPEASFWGGTQYVVDHNRNDSAATQNIGAPHSDPLWLNITYFGRDTNLSKQLTSDFRQQWDLICRAVFEDPCTFASLFDVEFSHSSADLISPLVSQVELLLRLPTPSLIGVPADEASYQALLNAYVTEVHGAMLLGLQGYRCCDSVLYAEALASVQLEQAGIAQQTLNSADYQRVLFLNEAFNDQLYGWRKDSSQQRTADDWMTARALAEFLHERFDKSVTDILPETLQMVDRVPQWISLILAIESKQNGNPLNEEPSDTEREALFREFQDFLIARSDSAQLTPPLPFPAESLTLACNADNGHGFLYQLDPVTGRWNTLLETGETFADIRPLPTLDGLWLQFGQPDAFLSTNGIWQKGNFTSLNETLVVYEGITGPSNELYLRRMFLSDTERSNNYFKLDPRRCSAEQCQLQPVPGYPRWSPDGNHVIYHNPSDAMTLASADGTMLDVVAPAPLLEQPITPYAHLSRDNQIPPVHWISDEQFVWRSAEGEYVTRSIDTLDISRWLSITNLRLILPLSDSQQWPSFRVFDARSPQQPAALMLQVYEGQVPQHVVGYDLTVEQMRYIGELSFNEFIGTTAQGEWLISMRANRSDDSADTLQLLRSDIRDPQRYLFKTDSLLMTHPQQDEWLAIADNELVRLIAPNHDYIRFVHAPAEACVSGTWLASE